MKVSKALSDRGWKEVASDSKVKDNGLQKALEKLAKVADDAHEEAATALSDVSKLAQALKKDRAVAAMADVVKYLDAMIDAAAGAVKLAEKGQAEQQKKQKAEQKAQAAAEARKKKDDDEADDEEDADEDEDDETSDLLTTKFKPLLKLVQKGNTLQTLVAKSGKKVVIMLSRKPIPPARRRILSEALGGGSTKYYPGTCSLEAGVVTFHLSAEVAGLTKLVKLALLEQSGIRINKVLCRGEDGEDNEDD